MNGQNRKDIKPGLRVYITQKHDQRTRKLTSGVVKNILTTSAFHSHAVSRSGLQPGKWGACRRSWGQAIRRCAMTERDVHALRAEALAALTAATQAASSAPDVECAQVSHRGGVGVLG